MDGGVGHQDRAGLLGLVAAPLVVLADIVPQVLPQNGTVERADGLDVQPGGLLQKGLDGRAVLAHDVEVIPGRPLDPGPVGGQRAEGAEAVGGEEDLLAGLIAHHNLRPVDHGGHDEGQDVPAQGEGIPLLDGDGAGAVVGVVFGQHGEGFGVAHHRHIRVFLQKRARAAGVVGLQVVEDQVVGLPAGELLRHAVQPLRRGPAVHGVQNGGFLVQDDV